jgi:hypothetical protein
MWEPPQRGELLKSLLRLRRIRRTEAAPTFTAAQLLRWPILGAAPNASEKSAPADAGFAALSRGRDAGCPAPPAQIRT